MFSYLYNGYCIEIYSLIHDSFSQTLKKNWSGRVLYSILKKKHHTDGIERENACRNRGIWMVGDHRMEKLELVSNEQLTS